MITIKYYDMLYKYTNMKETNYANRAKRLHGL